MTTPGPHAVPPGAVPPHAVPPRADGPLLLGVRHHGPGSARAVRAALGAARPRVVLVEGPPEGDALLALAAEKDMRPPVALLAHVADDPGRAAFWPMAEFSPEWVAIRWALAHGAEVRLIDLPAAHSLALADGTDPADPDPAPGAPATTEPATPEPAPEGGAAPAASVDPVGALAEAAGYDDPERWWEDVVEHRGAVADPLAPFAALGEAMAALRETYGDGGHAHDLIREAHMRQQLCAAVREFGVAEVAVVCGAWHVPALAGRFTVAADRALLKGLPKVKAELTWVPWTHRRLARRSGYGAGMDAPGWYRHLFEATDRPVERWMTKVAGLLREEDRQISSAHVIEAVRLAGTLAAMRDRPLPGLAETMDAVRAVMCEGSDVPLGLIHDRLVVGDVLGEVPDAAPAVPLQRDLVRIQRGLRLKPEAAERELELDLRKETDAGRSRLLHRLRLLGIGWGERVQARSTGTFRESWRLSWEPELSVRVAEAGVWGTTVVAAATAKARADAAAATSLGAVTALAERCLLAELPGALAVVMRALADRAALDTDVAHLAQALPALARALRYGDVRGTGTAGLAEVAAGLAERICVGFAPACSGLDADGAAEMRTHLDAVHTATRLLAGPSGPGADGLRERWSAVLVRLASRDTVPGVIRGRAARLLLDEGSIESEDAARYMGLALSPGTAPADAAAWIEGFVGGASGGGMLLVHDDRLLALVDGWLTGVPPDAFTDVLPLLRRTFAAYDAGARRTLGELVRRGPAERPGPGDAAAPGFGAALDTGRADAVLPLMALLLGRTAPAPTGYEPAPASTPPLTPPPTTTGSLRTNACARPDDLKGSDTLAGTDACAGPDNPDDPVRSSGPDGDGRDCLGRSNNPMGVRC
ncbi:DUF5682 family protein [Streptomyces sp. Edi4]|uniref:DUF5682 family protein n=1 Tax=Streptomyces sp. Edi4 TaxID=3162527 RepID=UPI0033065D42